MRFVQQSRMPVPAEELFRWHARPGALERLTPPWERVEVLRRTGEGLAPGSRVELLTRLGPLRQRWVAEHRECVEGSHFTDEQTSGPFARWSHTHRMDGGPGGSSTLTDEVDYELPFGLPGRLLGGRFVSNKLRRLFRYRHETTAQDLATHARYGAAAPFTALVTGSGGLIGSALLPFLTTGGHRVRRLQRGHGELTWDPARGSLDPAAFSGVDAVIHLAGESLASGRWNAARKRAILESRVAGTRLLCERAAASKSPPRVIVAASAIGFYGDRGDTLLDESASRGQGFLAKVCEEWEAAAKPAEEAGIRVVRLRIGVVLSPAGGALGKMLPPFRTGAGGRIGHGRQSWSWVALDDLLGAILHAIATADLRGPVNVVAPEPVTNAAFTKTLGRVLGRPTLLPMPAFAARLALGEMADELLLASQRVTPRKLLDSGYAFRYPNLEGALRHLLGRNA